MTVTAKYTNQAGTANQVTQAAAFGAGCESIRQIIELPLASGDYGVRSVESITLSATSGTAGNVGVTLAKPLAIFPVMSGSTPEGTMFDSLTQMGGYFPNMSTACPFFIYTTPFSSTAPAFDFSMEFCEE